MKGNTLNGAHDKIVNPRFACAGYNNHRPDCDEFIDNKNSFFSISDGKTKIIGVFDGHGPQGHIVSSAAMGTMLDYLRNKNDVLLTKNMSDGNFDKNLILPEIKKAFKYV